MSSAAKEALAGYVAGRVTAERVVATVAAAYYGDAARGRRDVLRPVIDVVERAAPGFVELAVSAQQPGYEIRHAGRPFPKQYEAELRRAAAAVLQAEWGAGKGGAAERPGFLVRLVQAIGRLLGRT